MHFSEKLLSTYLSNSLAIYQLNVRTFGLKLQQKI